MTPTFALGWGVRQGCPLSCHLFNLVGQVLIYYLWDNSFFCWNYSRDPYSLYADDTAIFLSHKSDLPPILAVITHVGTFTGLSLNIDKTIAFCPNQEIPDTCCGVVIAAKPVKYLRAFLELVTFLL